MFSYPLMLIIAEFKDVVPLIVALVAAAVALTVAALNMYLNRADRRRDLYSAAYRAALAWVELFYRVRRRDKDNPRELVALFHQAQEDIDYHQGWLTTESAELGRAYATFVAKVKAETRPLIQQAWTEDPCDLATGMDVLDGDRPDVETAKRQFLSDVSDHLSLSPERRLKLKARYRR
jgi:hypothetical protein